MALLNTDFLSAHDQTFRAARHLMTDLLQEGVIGATDYDVTPGGASLQWSVAAGVAWVQGDDATRQGIYHQINDAAVTGLVAAGHATLPRLDQVILSIKDSSVTGVSDTPTLSTLAGTATSGATLANRNGAASLPATALRLADILVPAAHSGVLTTGMINDRRSWARGGFKAISYTGGDTATLTSTTWGDPFGAGVMAVTMECSGVPVRVAFLGSAAGGGTSPNVLAMGVSLDGDLTGTATSARTKFMAGTGASTGFLIGGDIYITPSAGRHTFEFVTRITTSGNYILRASTSNGAFEFAVMEMFRANADNT